MNVYKTTAPDVFRPYELTISVECIEDEIILLKLSQAQFSIPELLYPKKTSPTSHNQTVKLLNNLMKAIQS